MTEAGSPFGGGYGGGSNKGNSYNPPAALTNIFNAMNYARYLIDPAGVKIEICFDLINGKCATKVGETVSEFNFIKL